ncbi:hypothetical protein GCM10022284_36610 [Streptomyces hundungensis]
MEALLWVRGAGGAGRAWLLAQFPAPLKPAFGCGPLGPFAQFPAPLKTSVLARIGRFSPAC